jgi:hypothetical protein
LDERRDLNLRRFIAFVIGSSSSFIMGGDDMKRSAVSMLAILAVLGVLVPLVAGCGDSCLEQSTLVRTPEGLVSIGELKVGDAVVSIDPSTGVEATTHVARVSYAWAWCEKLVVGDQPVWLTEEHPLYSPEASAFRPAESWLTGKLRHALSQSGTPLVTTGGGWLDQRPCRVVDLTVDEAPHTFVAAGIVVHNKSDPECLDDRGCRAGYVCEQSTCVADDGGGGSGGKGGSAGGGGVAGQGGTGGAAGGG